MIGDHKQLGPIYKTEIKGPQSLFERLIEGGYPYTMLEDCYRMHPYLLNIPNTMFYDNKIKSQYQQSYTTSFLNKKMPFLFIDCNSNETRYGTSYMNEVEAEIIVKLTNYLMKKKFFTKDTFGFISPYQG